MSKQRAATPSSPLADVDQPLMPAVAGRSQQEAAELRWTYYKANKSDLVSEISLHRDTILESLMLGASPEAAFAPYRRQITITASPAARKPLRANAQALNAQAPPQSASLAAGAQPSQWIDSVFNPRRQAVLAEAARSRKDG